jgi:nucleoside-diphosphate-sugar epimerase
VVHLAAIVGDPACALDPKVSDDVNVQATRALVADANELGVERLVFASTCSNYGRMADPNVPITEEGELRPVSLYAEQKVGMEQLILASGNCQTQPTCLRFATVYGVGRRMRFDLTVNEFTRDLWADRELEVFGEQFWRPYIHVRDAARAVRTVLETPTEKVAGRVFNAGRSGENYRKLDLVDEIGKQVDRGSVSYVRRDEDPRDYKVSFDKIKAELGFETLMTVPDGIAEIIAALDVEQFGDPYDGRYRNIP